MENMNSNPPKGKYMLVIIISALMVVIAFAAAGVAVTYLITELIKTKGKMDFASGMSILCIWLPVAWIVVTAVTYYPLAKKRQSLRDMCEYDRFGNLRKGFSTMSSEQRKRTEERKMMDVQRVMPDSFIKANTHEGPADPDAEMAKLTGLNQIRQSVLELKAQLEFDQTESKKEKKQGSMNGDGFHMAFIGTPGTGKTTVARIITSYLYKYKMIKKNRCIEVDGNAVKGDTPHETNLKVTRLLQSAIGGVLFIDEAYAIAGRKGENKEAVATLIKFMEDFRNEFVLIFAGYENEMRALISSNPGFKSRITIFYKFPSYSMPELKEIFMKMAGEEGYAVDGSAYPLFEEIMSQESRKPDFGNARTVRKCLSATIRKHKSNYMNNVIPAESRYSLRYEDITYDKDFI